MLGWDCVKDVNSTVNVQDAVCGVPEWIMY